MNKTPSGPLVRMRDVLAWIPAFTKREIIDLEKEGVIHSFQKCKGAKKLYYTVEIEKLCCVKGMEALKANKK